MGFLKVEVLLEIFGGASTPHSKSLTFLEACNIQSSQLLMAAIDRITWRVHQSGRKSFTDSRKRAWD